MECKLRYLIFLAPVELTFKVKFATAAVFVTVNFIAIQAPVTKVKPVQAAVLAAVPAEVEQVE